MTPLLITAIILAYMGVAVGLVKPFGRKVAGERPHRDHREVAKDAVVFGACWPITLAILAGYRLLDHAERWIFKEGE